MDNPAIIAAWAAALAAFFGPIVSVAMAHLMLRQENKRRDSAFLFRRLAEDINSYRVAFMQRHYAQTVAFDATPGVPPIGRGGEWLGSAAGKEEYDQRNAYYRQIIQYSRDSGERMRSVQAMLRADQTALNLFFGKAGETCIKKIGELYELEYVFGEQPRPSHEECEQLLTQRIDGITAEMEKLFETTARPDEIQ